jgi:hypothetical protein
LDLFTNAGIKLPVELGKDLQDFCNYVGSHSSKINGKDSFLDLAVNNLI